MTMIVGKLLLRNQERFLSTRGPVLYRSFFASSTDHTTLLQNAVVHRLDGADGHHQYVMAAEGMDVEMVKKVPQLHLARINRDGATLYGAKVVNSTLGTPTEVCGRLVDAALEDAASTGEPVLAKSTLHGLSDWVLLKGEALAFLHDEKTLLAVQEIAQKGSAADEEIYNSGKLAWENLAQEYIQKGLGAEAALYRSKGGIFSNVLHHADTSDYASTSGGAMATFSF